jgi:glutaredoxin
MKGADPKSSGTERTRIVPIMVFVDPNCNQCIKLVEALHRKGFQCNVLDVYARASKKYLTWYGEAISRSIEEKGD